MKLFRRAHRLTESAERVTAYVDGELSGDDRARFEADLQESLELREAVETERALKLMLRSTLREVPAPRSFALTPEMVGASRPVPARSWFPAGAARLAQATAALAIIGFATLTMIDLSGGTSDDGRDSSQAAPASMEADGGAIADDTKEGQVAPLSGAGPEGTPGTDQSQSNEFRAAGEGDESATALRAPTGDDSGFGALRLAQVATALVAIAAVGVYLASRRSRSGRVS